MDPDGKDYWSTNDPALIGAFMNSLKYGFESHNFYGWHHATDADFTGDLTYNDITGKYYTSYGDVVNGEAVRIGLSFDARIIPRIETFGYEGGFAYAQPVQGFWGNLGYYTGISGRDKYFDGIATWEVNREGRITGLQPIMGIAPSAGMGGTGKYLKGLGRVAKGFHRAEKGGKSIKETILKTVGLKKFTKIVGRNPDIIRGKNGKIYLKGNGCFKGKELETDLWYEDFFNL
ncbi:hypothetical protein DW919_19470 [Odoribacter splanchnicus]|nr:hypothetical protein DW919_19470 [Odoribacter splanchnicus]